MLKKYPGVAKRRGKAPAEVLQGSQNLARFIDNKLPIKPNMLISF